MIRLLLIILIALMLGSGCSDEKQATAETKEQAKNKHILSAQLETLEKAKEIDQMVQDRDKKIRAQIDN